MLENSVKPVYPSQAIEYYKVPLDLYEEDEPLEADLYMYYQGQYIVYKSKGQLLPMVDRRKLSDFGVSELYVKFDSRKDHQQFLEDKLSKLLDRSTVPLARKAQVLYEVSEPMLASIYTTPGAAEDIAVASGYVKNCIKYLNERGSLPELISLSGRTLTEHVHALHVSSYSIAAAKRMGFQSFEEIFAIGMGGLLHDIGKSKIEAKILKKPGELDESEWQIIRQHPQWGDEILDRRQTVPMLSRRIVLEHHERSNGKGYPKGIKSAHVFSKIVGIADVFASLAVERPWAPAMRPFDALKFIITSMRSEFDEAILTQFIEMLSK